MVDIVWENKIRKGGIRYSDLGWAEIQVKLKKK